MSHRIVIEEYYKDINNLSMLLNGTVNSYKVLDSTANDFNNMALAKKSDVKNAIKRANELGEVVDDMISAFSDSIKSYNRYIKTKSDVINQISNSNFVRIELDNALKRTE